MKTLYFTKIIDDESMRKRDCQYFDSSHYHTIVTEDCDGYIQEPDGTQRLLFKLRKGVIAKNLCNQAVDSFSKFAKKLRDNRGTAAGPITKDKIRNYVAEIISHSKHRAKFRRLDGTISKTDIGSLSPSQIVGYFDKKDRNKKGPVKIPCRLTAFTRDNQDKWQAAIPFIQRVDQIFAELVPEHYARQKARAELTPKYVIPDTSFSTITVNYSWRTACHKDKGDYEDGFGNLVVCEDQHNPNDYKGCCFGFPQYGVCINVRGGDFLAANVHEWHCNTEFEPVQEEYISHEPIKNEDTRIRYRNSWNYSRLSFVFYLRHKMADKCQETIE